MAIVDRALDGRVALVTGASRGIGRAIATALGRRGARVCVNYQAREDAARETADAIDGAWTLKFDVADPTAVEAGVKACAEKHGRLDIVVANAGVAIDGLLLRVKDEDWRKTLDVNLTGVFACLRAACRHLLKAKDAGR